MTGGGGAVTQRMSKSDKDKQVRDLWNNYLSWNRDIEIRRDRDISSEKARMAGMGMEAGSDQWNKRLEAINQALDKEKSELSEGATIKSLRSYYSGEDAKRFGSGLMSIAESKAQKDAPDPTYQRNRGGERVKNTTGPNGRVPTSTPQKVNGRITYEAERDRVVNKSRSQIFEALAKDATDQDMLKYYEQKFGTDPTGGKNKSSSEMNEVERSKKKAKEAARGGTSSGSTVEGSPGLSTKKKDKNPWI